MGEGVVFKVKVKSLKLCIYICYTYMAEKGEGTAGAKAGNSSSRRQG